MSYKLDRQIGRGYSSVVYSGYSKAGKRVALKVIKTDKQEDVEKFLLRNEIQFLSSLDHENILKLIEYYEEPKQTIIITELYEEGTLEANLKKIDFTQEANIYQFVSQITSALLHIKQKNIVHNDLKPSNILVQNQKYIIADFGFSFIQGKNNFKCILGTPSYMSPETFQDGKMTHKSDMWSLGVTIYEVSQGKQLFSDDYREATKQVLNNFQLNFKPYTQTWVRQIITQLLNRNVESRLSIEQLHQILDNISQSRISYPKSLKSYNIEDYVYKLRKKTNNPLMIYILDGILLLNVQKNKNEDLSYPLQKYLKSSLYVLLKQQHELLQEISKEEIENYQENINGFLNLNQLYQYIDDEGSLQYFESTFNYATLQYILNKYQL